MKKYHIPTAAYENFDNPEAAIAYLKEKAEFPIVLKADGLALGKGVLICNTLEEAEEGVKTIMLDKKFGSAGNTLVIERVYDWKRSVCSFLCRRKDHQDYDLPLRTIREPKTEIRA